METLSITQTPTSNIAKGDFGTITIKDNELTKTYYDSCKPIPSQIKTSSKKAVFIFYI